MSMSLSFTSSSPENTLDLGRLLGLAAEPGDVVLLTGELGSGKTQLTKGIALALGVKRPVTSPTFNIIYEYQDEGKTLEAGEPPGVGEPLGAGRPKTVLRHFDLYRLEKEEELDDIDYFGLLEDDVVSVVEWGDKFPEALPNDYLLVEFEYIDEFARLLQFQAAGRRGEALLERLKELAARLGLSVYIADEVPEGKPNGTLGGTSGGIPGVTTDGSPNER